MPLFLQRRPYRRRRRVDAARLLPVFGLFLLLLPLLWAPSGTVGQHTAREGLYLFMVWAALVATARVLAPGLTADDAPDGGGDGGAGGSEGSDGGEPGGGRDAGRDGGRDRDAGGEPG